MNGDLARFEILARAADESFRPPPILSLSEWADRKFYLSPESAAEPGRWRTLPYQKGMMDAVTDPTVEKISVMKSARVGYTKMIDATVGYFIDQDQCSMLVVQPTVDDAKGFSKEEIAPMLRDCPDLAKIIFNDEEEMGPKDSGNTILHKRFPGGVLSLAGANSAAGFRRVTRRVVIFDETDGYPPSAGAEGDQIKLGTMRTQTFWNRKIIAGSTPTVAGISRIESLFESGDQRRYYVPCPQCGHMDFLVFSRNSHGDRGHWMEFEDHNPRGAWFVCRKNGCVMEHKDKRQMVERGEWRAEKPFTGHASFHIWAAYSYSANATWGHIAEEWIDAQKDVQKLKTFINTVLGETWKERGDAPEWEKLYRQREDYSPTQQLPPGVQFLTAGVDVQKDRFVYEVIGWGADKQSWSVEAAVLPVGDTSIEANWAPLDALLGKSWNAAGGHQLAILCLAVDSGFNTNQAYSWARRYPMARVIATKGQADARALLNAPSPVDLKLNGKRFARGYKVWPVGVSVAKTELYGWLGVEMPVDGEAFPAGFCHFSKQTGPDFFKQLTAEHLVMTINRKGFAVAEWQMIPGRENHWLDARVYARAAAAHVGLDRMVAAAPPAPTPVAVAVPPPAATQAQSPKADSRVGSRFLGGRGKDWFKR